MTMGRRLIGLVVLLAAAGCKKPAPAPTPVTLAPGDHDLRLGERRYVVHVPAKMAPKPAVVVALHGGGGDAMAAKRAYRLDAVAAREGFVVVYPEGTGRAGLGKTIATWNAGKCCARPEGPDDVAFVESVLDDLARRLPFDAERVYATGLSNGSDMAQRLACESDRFAAISATGMVYDEECKPARPVPLLYAAGRLDPCATFDGGTCGGCWHRAVKKMGLPVPRIPSWPCPPVEVGVAGIAKRNGCQTDTREVFRAGKATCRTFQGCPAEVQLCVDPNLGHHWPGGAPPRMCEDRPQGRLCQAYLDTVGPASGTIDFAERSWGFFKRFSR